MAEHEIFPEELKVKVSADPRSASDVLMLILIRAQALVQGKAEDAQDGVTELLEVFAERSVQAHLHAGDPTADLEQALTPDKGWHQPKGHRHAHSPTWTYRGKLPAQYINQGKRCWRHWCCFRPMHLQAVINYAVCCQCRMHEWRTTFYVAHCHQCDKRTDPIFP